MKSATVSNVSPSICHEVMGPDTMILSFLNVDFFLGARKFFLKYPVFLLFSYVMALI